MKAEHNRKKKLMKKDKLSRVHPQEALNSSQMPLNDTEQVSEESAEKIGRLSLVRHKRKIDTKLTLSSIEINRSIFNFLSLELDPKKLNNFKLF